ncbi:DUF447 domain-containing protein [Archaeoglobales archaeon]|nr:MAG: DUF447 domain-containing protein [Archaeoglobales archaeon]
MKLADFGFREGINEIIAVTLGKKLNTAPIGIIVEDGNSTFAKAKLYPSDTRDNVEISGKLWANVVLDPIIFTISAFEDLDYEYFIPNKPVLKDALAYCEFEVILDGSLANLKLIGGEVLDCKIRAINRGFNVLIEALVHATRYRIVGSGAKEKLKEKILYYKEIVDKCGSDREKKAFNLLLKYIGLAQR